jgi:hypothetical protein
MMFLVVNDNLAYTDLNLTISLDTTIFLCGFLALFILTSCILLEVKRIRMYIKRRGDK